MLEFAMHRSLSIALLAVLLTGCAPVNSVLSVDQVVLADFREPEDRDALNRSARGKPVVLETTDGRRYEGYDFTLDVDSARFSVPGDSAGLPHALRPTAVATSDVRTVGFYVYGTRRYGLVGGGTGVLLGIIPGILVGLAGKNATPLEERQGNGQAVRNGALAGAVLGGLLGAALFMFAEGDLGPSVWRRYENRGSR